MNFNCGSLNYELSKGGKLNDIVRNSDLVGFIEKLNLNLEK